MNLLKIAAQVEAWLVEAKPLATPDDILYKPIEQVLRGPAFHNALRRLSETFHQEHVEAACSAAIHSVGLLGTSYHLRHKGVCIAMVLCAIEAEVHLGYCINGRPIAVDKPRLPIAVDEPTDAHLPWTTMLGIELEHIDKIAENAAHIMAYALGYTDNTMDIMSRLLPGPIVDGTGNIYFVPKCAPKWDCDNLDMPDDALFPATMTEKRMNVYCVAKITEGIVYNVPLSWMAAIADWYIKKILEKELTYKNSQDKVIEAWGKIYNTIVEWAKKYQGINRTPNPEWPEMIIPNATEDIINSCSINTPPFSPLHE